MARFRDTMWETTKMPKPTYFWLVFALFYYVLGLVAVFVLHTWEVKELFQWFPALALFIGIWGLLSDYRTWKKQQKKDEEEQ